MRFWARPRSRVVRGRAEQDAALAVCTRARAHEIEFRATSLTTLTQMVAGGAGVTLLPTLALETEGGRADLKVRAFSDPVPKRTLTLVLRPNSALQPALEGIATTLKEGYPR